MHDSVKAFFLSFFLLFGISLCNPSFSLSLSFSSEDGKPQAKCR